MFTQLFLNSFVGCFTKICSGQVSLHPQMYIPLLQCKASSQRQWLRQRQSFRHLRLIGGTLRRREVLISKATRRRSPVNVWSCWHLGQRIKPAKGMERNKGKRAALDKDVSELVTYKQGPDGVNIWAGCSLYRGKRICKDPRISICFMFRDQHGAQQNNQVLWDVRRHCKLSHPQGLLCLTEWFFFFPSPLWIWVFSSKLLILCSNTVWWHALGT